MQPLVGKLGSVHPEASESLRIVAYFDVLISRGAGIDALLRGAAVLSGAVACAEIRDRVTRRDPDGRPTPGVGNDRRVAQRSGAGWAVWLERAEAALTQDEMIVERLALGVELIEARRQPANGFEVVIDATRSAAERATALAKLRLNPAEQIRVVATHDDDATSGEPTAIVPTRYGLLRATLDVHPAGPPTLAQTGQLGFGTRVRADHAPESWDAAIVALRLTDATDPVIDAEELGAMLLLAQAYDPRSPHEDVMNLAHLESRSTQVLRAVFETGSIRSAAIALGMHHSTVQARLDGLARTLGYDPRTPVGKIRYVAAALLLRLTDQSHETPIHP